MSVCVIANPNAKDGIEQIAALEERVACWEGARLFRTHHAGEAEDIARRAAEEGCELVVAAGGDGTIHEVVNGIAGHFARTCLGVLPLGTGNDFARSLGLPNRDVDAAVAALRGGHRRPCDVVEVRTETVRRLFINVAGAGFSGEMGQTLTTELKRSWGPLAYLRAAIESLPELTRYEVELVLDGERVTTDGLNLVIANGRYVAAGIQVAPRADLADGLVDVLVLRPETLPALAGLASRVLVGQHLEQEDERVVFRTARLVEAVSDPPMPLNADGELLGHLPATFQVLPGALRVAVPPAEAET